MENYTFNFELNGEALHYLSRAMDKYVEKWPGGHPAEQEKLKNIQLGLHAAMLDYQLIAQELWNVRRKHQYRFILKIRSSQPEGRK